MYFWFRGVLFAVWAEQNTDCTKMFPPHLDGNYGKALLSKMDEGAGRLSVQRRKENRIKLVLDLDAVAPAVHWVLDSA